MEYLTENDVRNKLREKVLARKGRGGATAVAAEIGFSLPYLSDIMASRRDVSERFAEKLGYKRVVVFVPVEPEPEARRVDVDLDALAASLPNVSTQGKPRPF